MTVLQPTGGTSHVLTDETSVVEPRKLTVAVADDHPLVVSGLQGLFEGAGDMRCVGAARTGGAVFDMLTQARPDVLVMDIRMPGLNAIDVMQALASKNQWTRVVIYSGLPESRFGLPLARLGAMAFVDKTAEASDLLQAVRTVGRGGRYFSRALREQLDRIDDEATPTFTPRELQIFLRLADGETTGGIAEALSVCGVTVSVHRSTIFRKLGIESNAALTRYAVIEGFLQ